MIASKDLNLLRLLIVLNEERQTTLAAKRLNLSQPSISVMLRKLREQFNDPLFIRDKNQLEPTVKCAQLLEQLPSLLEQMDALYRSDSDNWDIAELEGEIQLLFSPPLMATLATPLIHKLTSLAPRVTVECIPWGVDAIAKLEANRMTWGISYLPMETNKNLIQKDLGFDKFVLMMRKDHPLQGNDLAETCSYPLCISIIPGNIEASMAERMMKRHGIDKRVNVRTSDINMMQQLIANSDYIGLISSQYTKISTDTFRFEPLPDSVRQKPALRPLSLFTHQRNRHDGLTQWLYKEAKNIMAGFTTDYY